MKTSGCRTQPYQSHLHEVFEHFYMFAGRAVAGSTISAMNPVPGIEVYNANIAGVNYQQLRDTTGTTVCQGILDQLNQEIRLHFPGSVPAEVSRVGNHVLGRAVDWTIKDANGNPLRSSDLSRWIIASGALLEHPVGSESWHLQLARTPPLRTATFAGHSPINILVQDPSGRKVGFDPATMNSTNQIGNSATYSGPGSEPQIIEISSPEVQFGKYLVSGIGTGNGSYSIDVEVTSPDDDDAGYFYKVLASGTAGNGQPLNSILPVDCIMSTMVLGFDPGSDGLLLRSPSWATNAVIQFSTNLTTWSIYPQSIGPTGGLLITNLTSGQKYFRILSGGQ